MQSPRPSRQTTLPGPLPALRLACCLILITIAGTLPALAAPTDEEIREAVEAVLADERFQTGLSGDGQPSETETAAEPNWSFDLPDGVFGIARLLMWVLIGAGVVLLAIFLINEISSFRLRTRGGAPREDGTVAALGGQEGDPGLRTSLEEADRLAGEGRFAEALHMLLLDCIAQLRQLRFDSLIAPSLTSREVASRLSLPEQSAKALSAIVSAVELSHFGGRVPQRDDYARCREGYMRIASESAGAA